MNPHRYTESEIAAVECAIRERRDIRHFVSDDLPDGLLVRLIAAACRAPSVGFMQP
jgi:5,6-dimethylbenzimidazole synthase